MGGTGVLSPGWRCPSSSELELLVFPRTDAAPFYQHHRSLESQGRASTPCFGDACLGDATWGSQLVFQPGGVYPDAFFFSFLFCQHVPLGGDSPGGYLGGWRRRLCPLAKSLAGR